MDKPTTEELVSAVSFLNLRLATRRAYRASRVARKVDPRRIDAAQKHLQKALTLLSRVRLPKHINKDLKKRGML